MPNVSNITDLQNMTDPMQLVQFASYQTDGFLGPAVALVLWLIVFVPNLKYGAPKASAAASIIAFVALSLMNVVGLAGVLPLSLSFVVMAVSLFFVLKD
jgi:hypothetical protein